MAKGKNEPKDPPKKRRRLPRSDPIPFDRFDPRQLDLLDLVDGEAPVRIPNGEMTDDGYADLDRR